jgi:hypothetical protein
VHDGCSGHSSTIRAHFTGINTQFEIPHSPPYRRRMAHHSEMAQPRPDNRHIASRGNPSHVVTNTLYILGHDVALFGNAERGMRSAEWVRKIGVGETGSGGWRLLECAFWIVHETRIQRG